MNNHAFFLKAFHGTRWAYLPVILCFFFSCSGQERKESARSGRMTVAVDRQLSEIAGIESGMFTIYYPEARIEIIPSVPSKTLGHLFDKSVRAAMISGGLDAAEDSLFLGMKKHIRKEPVALDAIVCITGNRNSITSLSQGGLIDLFFGREKGHDTFILKDDFRLVSVFSSMNGKRKNELHAWSCSNTDELVKRVAASRNAYAILFSSALETARVAGTDLKNVKTVPIASNDIGSKAYLPERDAVFENRYPLVATVYYVYYPGDALAAGFGSWISSAGQKAFERSFYVPFRLSQRTIILQ